MTKRFIPFIFAGVLGVTAVFMMQRYLHQQRRALDAERRKLLGQYQAIEPIEVIISRADVPEGTTLAAEHLDRRSIPKQFVQPYATTRATDVLGLVTVVPLSEGEQVLTNKLRRPDQRLAGATLADMTPEGRRAITIGTDALSGVGGFVRPGDHIDVLWTFQSPAALGGSSELVTVTLFQNISVLAVGPEMVGHSAADGEEAATSREATMTLALTPQETALLLFAREQGTIQLSLRPIADKDMLVAVPPANMLALTELILGKDAVGEPPKPPRTVEVFKGLERTVVAVDE